MRAARKQFFCPYFCFLAFSIPLGSWCQTQAPVAGNSAAEPVQYVLEDIQGSAVQVLETGTDQWAAGEEGEVLESGDELKVGADSEATLMLQSDTSVHVSANSDVTVDQIADNRRGGFFSKLKITAGQLLADVQKHLGESQSTFEVDANGVVCGVRGTAFEVSAQGDNVQTLTHEGTVDVKTGGQDNFVRAGNAFSFKRGRFAGQRLLDQEEIGRFGKWRAYRARVFEKHRLRLENIRKGSRRAWIRRAHRRHLRRALNR
jgi:ferric-dicitrate binding protein FerR (iron transport regulator)